MKCLLRFSDTNLQKLSSYDAAYLELAARRGLGLATLDARLAKVARKIGVKVWR